MTAIRRKFSISDKLAILQEAQKMGVTPVLHKYNLSYSVFYRWKQKMDADKGLIKLAHSPSPSADMKAILQENAMLKKIVVNLVLKLEMKNADL